MLYSALLLDRILALNPKHLAIAAHCIPVPWSKSIFSAVIKYFGRPPKLLSYGGTRRLLISFQEMAILSFMLYNSSCRFRRRLSINAFIFKKPWILEISNENAATIWMWPSNLTFKYSQFFYFPGESFSSILEIQCNSDNRKLSSSSGLPVE